MIRAILTDIEGTTSSIAFVKDVLFPYAREHMAEFIKSHALDPQVRRLLDDVCAEAGQTLNGEGVIAQLIQWINEDKKLTPLKILQGMLWEEGYRTGKFTGHVYEDAVKKLQEWHKAGIGLYIYSSGSVPAQKLLFSHTNFGDLTTMLSGYFDTRTGSKRESDSYRKISHEINIPENEILFLSDTAEELDAARAAGMNTLQLLRDEDGATMSPDHYHARNFNEIDLDKIYVKQ